MPEARTHVYNVFVSHGSDDLWVAAQISKELRYLDVSPFLDQTDIPLGTPDFQKVIHNKISLAHELIALFTPWSAMRSWVWIEIGAAWGRNIPILAVFYGMKLEDLDTSGQGRAVLEHTNNIQLDDFENYLFQLKERLSSEPTFSG